MSREVREWISKRDDDAIPPRVKDRVAQRAKDCCQKCGRRVFCKLRAEFDHIIPLIIGGVHRETNIQLLCHECHAAKTKLDVKLKSKIADVRQKHLGIKKRRRTIPGRKFNGEPIPARWID